MKKIILFIAISLVFSANSNAESIKKIHFICEFDKYFEIYGLKEKQISKSDLPNAILEDQFITIGVKPNDEIIILETSYWRDLSIYDPEDKIIIPYSITDNEIKFDIPTKSSGVEHYFIMNRRSGNLEMVFKNSVSHAKMYSSCSVKEKIF